MNFTKKLLLSAALVIAFVASAFAQEDQTFGQYTTIVTEPGTAVVLGPVATIISGPEIDIQLTVYVTKEDLIFSLATFNYTGSYTDKTFTISTILDGDKSTLSTTKGIGYGDKYINISDAIFAYSVDKLKTVDKIYFKVNKSVFVFTLDGLLDAVSAAINSVEDENPFDTGSDDPFDTVSTVDNFSAQAEEMNPFDLEGYIALFVNFAQQNGINLNYIYEYDVNIKFSYEHMKDNTIAYTTTLGDDKEVNIVVNPIAWQDASPAKRVAILFHELGHDVLNFEHDSESGPLMSVYAQEDYTIEEVFELTTQMFNDYKNGVIYEIN